ncbi:hypothetical protein SLEP1_g44537 [Rubroshorea leprosula]|uniref:Peptidase C1A papain C-terminal domain-containing protein n=1 Tax=Rubroshorea leprosula TaxID=152421 RepID=A0AAV5LGG7_9ROSI|nr:hypothetical protein SLEP1_g44537 [Rubroshorea leprosula]
MIHGFEDLGNDREGVLEAIDKQPVCAWIYVTRGFKEFMGDGIYVRSEEDEAKLMIDIANRKDQKHAVLIVGYGAVDNKPYFLIQNSWNTTRGSNGYAMVQRSMLNHFCYPNVENMKVAMGTNHYNSRIDKVKLR